MLGWVSRLFGGGHLANAQASLAEARAGLATAAAESLRARYDSAQTTDENRRLWGFTDLFSAKAANSFQVRQLLRRRARYEIANNSYANGMLHTNANDLIGTGPTFQGTMKDAAANRQVEAAWATWCRAVTFTEKLRTTKLAKSGDGEGFLVLKAEERVDHSVKLYPLDIEADQVTTPNPQFSRDYWVDGMVLDTNGNPLAYHILRYHPGDLFMPLLNPLVYDTVPARHVIHWFKKSRPGQARGIPELTPALDLFGEIRAYRKSVLTAARVHAALTALLESDLGTADATGEQAYAPYATAPIDNGMMTVLPPGMRASAFDPKQPTTTFDSFVEKLLGEACRCLNIPLNVALGTSQKFNFSSAKLDHINYRAGLDVERQQCETVVLERVFAAWFDEAVMIPGLLPAGLTYEQCRHEWHWPGYPSLDEAAEASADAAKLAAGLDTPQDFWARKGYDWRDKYAQLAEAKKEADRLDLTFGEPVKQTVTDTTDDPKEREAANAA